MLNTSFAACTLLLASAAFAQQASVPSAAPPGGAAPLAVGRGPAPTAPPAAPTR